MKWLNKYVGIGIVFATISLFILIGLREETELATALSTWAILVLAIFSILSLQYGHEQATQLKYEHKKQLIRQWALECAEVNSEVFAGDIDSELCNRILRLVAISNDNDFRLPRASQANKDALEKAVKVFTDFSSVVEAPKRKEIEKLSEDLTEAIVPLLAALWSIE